MIPNFCNDSSPRKTWREIYLERTSRCSGSNPWQKLNASCHIASKTRQRYRIPSRDTSPKESSSPITHSLYCVSEFVPWKERVLSAIHLNVSTAVNYLVKYRVPEVVRQPNCWEWSKSKFTDHLIAAVVYVVDADRVKTIIAVQWGVFGVSVVRRSSEMEFRLTLLESRKSSEIRTQSHSMRSAWEGLVHTACYKQDLLREALWVENFALNWELESEKRFWWNLSGWRNPCTIYTFPKLSWH